ncbi:uncharacterized protein LOC111698611 isoform X2 [Eurytemora carolleeae]|uniref:uncharacterized protein LOC111698611 isoform X2 n=1 Tax=Eurytemora carolleeae TaxID=1294199 RepID=UPI000C759A32|nr:uncharacterized protein LOC111698611 isoform X2 [Eurytemora carolleeae]|eukprot:XP_023324751.1 uncharacterized protein LOC111698611 isoform X2 [Eurytemora affinis]
MPGLGIIIIFLNLGLSLGLQCYTCEGKSGLCMEAADPGNIVTCPNIYSLLEDSVKVAYDYRWKALPALKTKNNLVSLIVGLFNSSLPQSYFEVPLRAKGSLINSTTTSLQLLEMVMDILNTMVKDEPENACIYFTRLGRDKLPQYYRKCVYTNKLALSDWSWVKVNLTQQSKGLPENCGASCKKRFCGENTCNDDGLFRCIECQGPNYLCSEDYPGVPTACKADQEYCINEMSGDSSNRKLSARYCGTVYDE